MSTSAAELSLAREAHRVLDPFHAMTYLAPQAVEAFHRIGLTRPWDGYFGGRTAPLGVVEPAVVSAVFYHFKPSFVDEAMLGLWDRTTPAEALTTRSAGVDAALRHLLGETIGGREVEEAAALAKDAAAACGVPARPLGAANAALDLPAEPHLALWQAVTTLREHRGDGHAIALAEAEFDGVEALVTITAAGGERRKSIQSRRGWSDAEWHAGEQRLADRGLLDAEMGLTEVGRSARQAVEDRTDRFALPPWRTLGERSTNRLLELLRPMTEQIVAGLRGGRANG